VAKVLTLGTSGIEEIDLDSQTYYQEISIENNESSTLTDYQVKFIINTSSLISVGKLDINGTGMKVLDESDNPIPFGYINETWNTTTTEFWLKIDSISASSTNTYRFVYGNREWLTKTADLEDVMYFVDQFEGTSIDTSKWELVTGTTNPTVTNGKISFDSSEDRVINSIMVALPPTSNDWIQTYKVLPSSGSRKLIGAWNGIYSARLSANTTPWKLMNQDGSTSYVDVGANNYSTQLLEIILDYTNDRSRARINSGTLYNNTSNFDNTEIYKMQINNKISGTLDVDYAYVRKYTENEPNVVIGSEEEYNTPVPEHSIEEHINVSLSTLYNDDVFGYDSSIEKWTNKPRETSYNYQEITIENQETSTLTDYQVKFIINTSSLISVGKLDINGTGMKVLDESDNPIPFGYINETWNTTTTEFWLKIPSIGASSTHTYKFVYGNREWLTKTADLDDVMYFADQFEGSSMDTSKWTLTKGTANPTVSDGTMNFDTSEQKNLKSMMSSPPSTSSDWIYSYKLTAGSGSRTLIGGSVSDAVNSVRLDTQSTNNWQLFNYTGVVSYVAMFANDNSNVLADLVLDFSNSRSRGRINNSSWYNNTGQFTSSAMQMEIVNYIGGTTDVDYAYVRKYTENEPTVTISTEREYSEIIKISPSMKYIQYSMLGGF